MHRPVSNLLIVALLCAVNVLCADSKNHVETIGKEVPESIFDRLSQNDVLQISIRTDIGKILNAGNSEKYQLAAFNIFEKDKVEKEWNIEIRVRGRFRNRICDFPSLKLKFGHSVLGPENLKAFNTLKLVTHCGDRAEAEELVLKEFIAYRLYNTITERSFRVQLVKIDWVDSKNEYVIGEKWGFLIENEDELAQRLDGGLYKEFGVGHDDLNPTSAGLNSLYQYMIGNSDWNIQTKKNIHLVKSHSSSDIYLVPYDFDFSGIVNAYYAVSEYGQTSVKERIYLGESPEEDLKVFVNVFKSKKDQILGIVNSYQYLSRSQRRNVRSYIQSFFQELDQPFKTRKYYEKRLTTNKEK